jgi:hypothetical protein
LRGKRGARAHRGDRNLAAMCADMADSDEQIRAAWWLSDVIARGGLERASWWFYRRSGLARGLGFRTESDRRAGRDAVREEETDPS